MFSLANISSANFSLEGWYKQQAKDSISKVVFDTENKMNRSVSDYNKFTTDIQRQGSRDLSNHTDSTISTARNNINNHSTEYIKQINSTINELKSTRYDQLVNTQISENNQEIDAEVNEMLEEILSN